MLSNRGWVRQSAVSGRFYPGLASELNAQVNRFLELPATRQEPVEALAVMVPHAGYIYSGATAGRVFAATEIPDRVIVISPNHTGFGPPVSVWSRGSWRFPFGEVAVDEHLAAQIVESHEGFEADRRAHLREHAVEVEVPFLFARNPQTKLVPIVVSRLPREQVIDLGRVLAEVIKAQSEPVLMVVSSDMSHYVSVDEAKARDGLALERIEALDPAGLYDVVISKNISMCGVMPATLSLTAAVELGAKQAELIDYTHSGQVTGDRGSVVAYAGVLVT